MDVSGKTAIVTGGATGLGKAIALKLAAEGADLAIAYARSEQDARETARLCASNGRRAIAVRADVAKDDEVRAMVARVRDELGRIDVLVNDAGTTINRPMSDLDSITEADWDRIMGVNVKAHWFTARAVAPHMREQGEGVIVNITSIAGLRPAGSSMPYCVSKSGAIMLTKCLAVGLAPQIRVNNIAPGVLLTRWWNDFPDEVVQQLGDPALLKRVTAIEDAASGALFAIKNDSLTGQTIVIDAGLHFH
jgi:3-oxoacyl-[acyl-carrier protein] reductase